MRQVSDIEANRPTPRESVVTIALRTPEAAKALNGASRGLHLVVFALGAACLSVLAWYGLFGDTVYGFIKLTIAIAVLHWASHTILEHWQRSHATRSDHVQVHLTRNRVGIVAPHRDPIKLSSIEEIRFSSRPHWLGREEERDERRVGHPVGYEFRDAWEVWCEAGLDVVLVAAVSTEDDARAIVRQLTEEYLFVARGTDSEHYAPERTEPA